METQSKGDPVDRWKRRNIWITEAERELVRIKRKNARVDKTSGHDKKEAGRGGGEEG